MTKAPVVDTAEPAESPPVGWRRRLDLSDRIPRYVAEMLIGLVLAALIALALIATVGSVPFIYQGY